MLTSMEKDVEKKRRELLRRLEEHDEEYRRALREHYGITNNAEEE